METIDTIYRIIQTNDSMFVTSHTSGWENLLNFISIGDILTLLGLFLTYFLFKRQLKETRDENIKGIKAQWFLEVVVEPNLDVLKKFYEDSIIKVNDSLIKLNTSCSKIYARDFRTLLAKEKRKYKDDLKDDLGHVQALIKATEPELSKDIDAKLDELIDVITKLLDQYDDAENLSKKVRKQLLDNQQEMLAILYRVIGNLSSDKPSKKRKKIFFRNK